MGGKIGFNEAQTIEEIIADNNEAKKKALNVRRGNSYYEKANAEQVAVLREILTGTIAEIGKYATSERVSLENFEEVQKRTLVYLRACEESATFPSCLGLARALGYSDRTLRHWRSTKPQTNTAQWLEMFNEACAEILSQSALKNNSNPIISIFTQKAYYGFSDKTELVITPNTVDTEENDYSADAIRERYLPNYNREEGTENGGRLNSDNTTQSW